MPKTPKFSKCCRSGACGGCLPTFKTARGGWVQCQCTCHNSPDVAGLIAEMLDGKEWSVETLDEIAEVLRTAGYQVRDVDDEQ